MSLGQWFNELLGKMADALQRVVPDWQRLEFGRIQSRTDWLLPAAVAVAVMLYVVWMYRRDSVELPRPIGWALAGLRLLAFAGLLLIYLQPQWPNEHVRIEKSRVLVLVDTSLSMRFPLEEGPGETAKVSRAEAIREALVNSPLLEQLRSKHDVVLLAFDGEAQDPRRIAALARREPDAESTEGRPAESASAAGTAAAPTVAGEPADELPADWAELLAPRGHETRLGLALRKLLYDERTRPVSGVIVLSDFGQNAGPGPESVLSTAAAAKIPIHTVGLGSDRLPANVRVVLHAPDRAYPNDPFEVEVLLQAAGFAGRSLPVELYSKNLALDVTQQEGVQEAILPEDGRETVVKFPITMTQAGRFELRARVVAPPGDTDSTDNEDAAELQITDRKPHVLLVAGGPSREYQFLRNMLYRSPETTVDVLLQTAQSGLSQEAHQILDEFPGTLKELADYDCVVAFDADWARIGPEKAQLLADWVAREAGGLVLVGGSIHMPRLVQRPDMQPLRDLFPVEFHTSFYDLDELDEEYGSKEPLPLELTDYGLQADFLGLDDSAAMSRDAWEEFPGIYSFQGVRRPKPTATVYARFTDPKGRPDEQRIYFAGQYFGQGRVFYLGSGEMWRLRALSEAYFERFYTKLIHHVMGSRVSRDNLRGELLVDSSQFSIGSTVSVTARLRNEQLEPLLAASVRLEVITPQKSVLPVELRSDPNDPSAAGIFRGQFTVREEGTYHLELPLGGADDQVLRRPPIQVVLPNLERDYRRRNDVLLKTLAEETGGQWYLGTTEMLQGDGAAKPPVVELLRDRTRIITEPDKPTRFWDDAGRATWAMFFICGVLALEWLVRRLGRLA